MLDPYRQLLMDMFGNTAAIDAAVHQQRATASGLAYLKAAENYMTQWQAYYSPALGQPAKPRACAYCGTKYIGDARCESCGAPNR